MQVYACTKKAIRIQVREENVIGLEEAVRRMTSLPAQKFGFTDRGLLRQNFAADIVLFNEAEVGDRAEYKNPHQYATGFSYIIVNGVVTVDAGVHTGARAGVAIRK
jgi:N-acyl-D-amino-acid deacylase